MLAKQLHSFCYQQLSSCLFDFFHFCLRQALDVAQSLACGHLDPLDRADTHRLHLFDVCHILKEGSHTDVHIKQFLSAIMLPIGNLTMCVKR